MTYFFLAIAGAIFLTGVQRWRQAVLIVPFLTILDGAVRKWFLPDYGNQIYFAKDVLLAGAYVGYFLARSRIGRDPTTRHPASITLALLLGVCVLQLANPRLPNLAVGLFGIKAYLMHVPLLFIIPEVFDKEDTLRRFWTAMFITALIPLFLGILQYGTSPDSEFNRYATTDLADIAIGQGGSVRVTSTFSYISTYVVYLIAMVLASVSFLSFQGAGPPRRLVWIVLALAIGNLLMTGSRGPFIQLAGCFVLVTGLAFRRLVPGGVIRPLAGLMVLVTLVSLVFGDAGRELSLRFEMNDDLSTRIADTILMPIGAAGTAGLAGFGVGTAHQASAALVSSPDVLAPMAEGEWERIILEIGLLGFLLVLLSRMQVTYRLWVALKESEEGPLRCTLIVGILFSIICLPGSLVYNHAASLFYWYFAGFALVPARFSKIEKHEEPAVSHSAPAE